MAHHLLEAMSRWILQKGYFYLAFGVLSIYKCVVLVVVFVCLWACAFKMCNKCAISNYWVCVSTSITQQLHTTWLWIGGWILLRSESSWRFQQVAVCVDLDKLQQHWNLWKLQEEHVYVLWVFVWIWRAVCSSSRMCVFCVLCVFLWFWRAVCRRGMCSYL